MNIEIKKRSSINDKIQLRKLISAFNLIHDEKEVIK